MIDFSIPEELKNPNDKTRSTIKKSTSKSKLEQIWDVFWKTNPAIWLANNIWDMTSDLSWTFEKAKDFWQWAYEKTKDIAKWWINRIQEAWEWISSWKYDIDEWLMRWAAWTLQTVTSPVSWIAWQWVQEIINKVPQWFKDFIAEKTEPTIEDAKIWFNSQPSDIQKELKNLWVWVEVLSYFVWANASKNVSKNLAKTWTELKDELVQWVKNNIKNLEKVPWQIENKIEQWLVNSWNRKSKIQAILAEDTTWNIIQWKSKDINPAIETFKQIDTEWVETYSDLWWKVKNKLNEIVKTQDEYLWQYSNPLNKDLAIKEVKTSKWVVKTNSIDNAVNDIDNVIVQTWEDLYSAPVWNRTLWEVIDNINNWNWTLKDYNDLARFYNSEFKSKIYNKNWEAKDAIQASKYEETRTWIKKFVRDNLPDDTLKQLDRDYANVAKTNELISKAVDKIQALQQKTREPWVLWKVWAIVWTGVDVMTWWLLRWVLWRILPRWLDTNRVDWIWIQKELRKNLNTLDKALWKQKTNPSKVSAVLWKIAWVKDKTETLKPKPIVIKKSDVKPERLALPQWKVITPQTIKKWKAIERKQIRQGIKIKEKAVIEESKKDIKNAKIWTTKWVIEKSKPIIKNENKISSNDFLYIKDIIKNQDELYKKIENIEKWNPQRIDMMKQLEQYFIEEENYINNLAKRKWLNKEEIYNLLKIKNISTPKPKSIIKKNIFKENIKKNKNSDEYENFKDNLFDDIRELKEEEFYKKYWLYPESMKNNVQNFESLWSKWRAFSDYEAKQEALSILTTEVGDISRNILKNELWNKIKNWIFKIYRIWWNQWWDVSYTINPNIKLPWLTNYTTKAYEININNVKFYDFLWAEWELILKSFASPKEIIKTWEWFTKNWKSLGIVDKSKQSVTTKQPQNVSKEKSNKAIVNKKETTTEWKKESSSDRISRLIQEAKDRDNKKWVVDKVWDKLWLNTPENKELFKKYWIDCAWWKCWQKALEENKLKWWKIKVWYYMQNELDKNKALKYLIERWETKWNNWLKQRPHFWNEKDWKVTWDIYWENSKWTYITLEEIEIGKKLKNLNEKNIDLISRWIDKNKIDVLKNIINEHIKKYWEKFKDYIAELVDKIADTLWTRSKFMWEQGIWVEKTNLLEDIKFLKQDWISKDEALEIQKYTMEWNWRKRVYDIDKISEIIWKLPNYKWDVTRVTLWFKHKEWDTFSSNLLSTQKWERAYDDFSWDTLIKINNSTNWKDISNYSTHKWEAEILFPKWTQFRVKKIYETWNNLLENRKMLDEWDNFNKINKVIELEEVNPIKIKEEKIIITQKMKDDFKELEDLRLQSINNSNYKMKQEFIEKNDLFNSTKNIDEIKKIFKEYWVEIKWTKKYLEPKVVNKTGDEINEQAIKDYTSSGYIWLNDYLRNWNWANMKMEQFSDKVSDWLRKLDNFKWTTYRKIKWDYSKYDMIYDFEVWETYTDYWFMSTTPQKWLTDKFSYSKDTDINLVIKSKTWKDISKLNIKWEPEVLFNKWTNFKILDVNEDTRTIILEEIK